MYAPFDVPALLGRPLEVSLTKDSGVAGLVFLIRQHLGIDIDKNDPRLHGLHDEIVRQFDAGRQTGLEWEELQPMVDHYRIGSGPGETS
jgi:2-phosphinomethylmalic acid synthase